eukprot:1655607-Rhodomonas_salina.1
MQRRVDERWRVLLRQLHSGLQRCLDRWLVPSIIDLQDFPCVHRLLERDGFVDPVPDQFCPE